MQEICSNIYKFDSKNSGKNIIILGGVHGSEKTGILVIKKLLKMFTDRKIEVIFGSLVLALGNEEAIKINKRWGKSGIDLNRCFAKDKLENTKDESYELKRARQLANIMDKSDILLDIHSTNTPSRAFLACENEPKHHEVHKWFDVRDVITDPKYILSGGKCSTTDEYMNACGGIGVCIETGYSEDISSVDKIIKSIFNILIEQGVIKGKVSVEDECKDRNVYKMHDRIDLTQGGFEYEGEFGNGDFKKVKKGQIIGYHGSNPYKSPIDGIVLLQFPQNLWQLNGPVGYIAKKI